MFQKNKKVVIFVDSKKESGGAYQELLYSIKNIKKHNKNSIKFSIICTSKNLNVKLEEEGFEIHYFSLNSLQRYICYLRNFNFLFKRIKKYFFFKNKFELFLKKRNIDIVYFTAPSQYSLYLENIKFIITVPDVNYREDMEYPEFVNDGEFQRKEEIFSKSLPRALAVITNAEVIKKKLSFFYRILESKIYVISHQPSSSINNFQEVDKIKQKQIREKFKLPQKYIFYPAMYLPHKNHKTLIDSLKILRSDFKMDLNIVFTGKDSGNLNNLKKYAARKKLNDCIYFLNFVENDYLPYLYLDAFVLTMISMAGPTFIPPWEAFKMEVPVIYSELDGAKEVYGNAVHYTDALDSASIAKAIKEIYENEELRLNLVINGKKLLKQIEAQNDYRKLFEIINNYRKLKENWEFDD